MAEKMNAKKIAKLEAAGAKRWSKYDKDRIYIDVALLGAEIDYYRRSGNISSAEWRGERVSNANGGRLLASKVYVDVADGSLHVCSDFDEDSIREAAEAFMAEALA